MKYALSNIMPKVVFGALIAAIATTSALAVDNGGPIDTAIHNKIIGEQANGYIGFVNQPTAAQAELQRAVNELNARRRAVYTDVASSTNETVDRVALVQAMRQVQKTANGDYFKDVSGRWCAKSASSRAEQAPDNTIVISCGQQ